MGSTQSNNLAQTPDNTPIADKNTGKVNFIWNQWFTNVQIKLNTITAAIVALSKNATAGFFASDGAGGVYARTLIAGTNVTITNPTGAGGNPTISASGGGGGGPLIVNTQTASSYILVSTDSMKIVDMNTSAAATIEIDTYANQPIPIGSNIYLEGRANALMVTPINSSIVVFNNTDILANSNNSFGQLLNIASDTWVLSGNIKYLLYAYVSFDGSSYTGWTNVGASINTTFGNPAPSFGVGDTNYASYNVTQITNFTSHSITLDVYIPTGYTYPLIGFYFGCNSTGAGYYARFDARGGSDYVYIDTCSSWASYVTGGGTKTLTTDTWYSFIITIDASNNITITDTSGTVYATYAGATFSGNYIGMVGQISGSYAYFDNIRIT